jgi:acetyl-CoA carboxylase beta subunit
LDDLTRRREDEWFRQHERKLLEEARVARERRDQERKARETDEERRRLKEQHWMRCPKCGHALRTEDLEGIEIDRCTFCEGFFMDAGELEQLFLQKEQAQRQGIVRRLLRI